MEGAAGRAPRGAGGAPCDTRTGRGHPGTPPRAGGSPSAARAPQSPRQPLQTRATRPGAALQSLHRGPTGTPPARTDACTRTDR